MSDKICVVIPSYMDSELVPTIKDLFNKASNPQRLDVYVLTQGVNPLLEDFDVTEIFIPYQKSKGLCWALHVLQSFVENSHSYYAQFDSHIRFDQDWDDLLIQELSKYSDPTVISTYPGQYFLNSEIKSKGLVENYIAGFRSTGSAIFGSRETVNDFKSTISGGFLFAPVEFILQVPVDPFMNFEFIEFDQTIRAYVLGWDIKSPKREGIVYHLYSAKNKLTTHRVDDSRNICQADRFKTKILQLSGSRSLQEFELDYQTKLPQVDSQKFISMPIAVANDHFKWQLELFWYRHKKVYGLDAINRANALIIERNTSSESIPESFGWGLDIPFDVVKPYFDYNPKFSNLQLVQSNVQLALQQVLYKFKDTDVIELLDCDLFHLKRHPDVVVRDGELYCDPIYEEWHLKSKTDNKFVISPYLERGGDYNGGFVPIVATVKTFKSIIEEWVAVNVDIVKRDLGSHIIWWSSMYALQAACEKAGVRMIDFNKCYIHGLTDLNDSQYICHYSVDGHYIHKNNKEHLFSNTNLKNCLTSNLLYARQFGEWLKQTDYVR